jgi:hypothetical protein
MTKKIAIIFGWTFIVLGILSLISNPIIGIAPGAFLAADTARTIVNFLSGIIFLWIAYGAPHNSRKTLKVFGIVYIIIAIVGFFSSSGTVLGLIATNTADNWLALIFALICLWAGVSSVPMATQGM